MASVKEITGFIKAVPMFHGLSNRQLENIAKRMVERTYKEGDMIVQQGQGGEGFFIITAGKAEAFRRRADGESVMVNEFGRMDFFGELALLDDGPRTATIQAKERTQCIVLVRWDFLALLKEDAEMAVAILIEMARRFRVTLDTM